jgi:GxxExxY protein
MHDPMRLDLLVGEKVIIEVKAVEKNNELHKAQLLTYLRLTNLKLGLVLNFGQATLLDGLTRVVNGL